MVWTKVMVKISRYKYIDRIMPQIIFLLILIPVMLTGCQKESSDDTKEVLSGARNETASDSHVDFDELKSENEDIFAWVYVPDTSIDYPVCQSSEGDDSFYITHNVKKEEDPNGAIYTECANLMNMCDFNEILHGSSPSDGTMFYDLNRFLDRAYFDEHEYIYVYIEGNALIYYVFAAYTRNDHRLLEEYDFTYASGCKAFLDEIYSDRSMGKIIRSGWDGAVKEDNFIITLSTHNIDDPSRQTVVIGCLVGDVRGTIDRVVDYSDPSEDW